MKLKPIVTGCAALLLSAAIDFTVVTPHLYIDRIVDVPIKPVALVQPLATVSYATLAGLDSAPVPPPVIPPGTAYHADNGYEEYIFQAESGGHLDAVNEIGCIGLGQSCATGLDSACPNWRTDIDCQLAFWDNYATVRYGSWYQAYLFRSSHNWW